MRRFYQGLAIAIALSLALLFVVTGMERAARAQGGPPPTHPVDPNAKPGTPGVFQDYTSETPGHMHHITAKDLPDPYATKSSALFGRPVPRPDNVWPQAPEGFKVDLYATKLDFAPRTIIKAPNGDFFIAATNQGKIMVVHGMTSDGKADQITEFASGLNLPFGLAFYPPGPNPQYLYVGDTNAVLRFPYATGDLKATGPSENVLPISPPARIISRAAWPSPSTARKSSSPSARTPTSPTSTPTRANFTAPTSSSPILTARTSRLRHRYPQCSGVTVNPTTGELWASVNERDELGDNIPPDYITHVKEGGFYGWPWYYIGCLTTRASRASIRSCRRRRSCLTCSWSRTTPRWTSPFTKASNSRTYKASLRRRTRFVEPLRAHRI